MTHRGLLQIVILSIAVPLATAVIGWYAVPVLGCLWGAISRGSNRPALSYSIAAGLGWAVLLVWTASQGPMSVLAGRAAGVFGVRAEVLYAVTILFPVPLAWGSAVVGEYAGKIMQRTS